MDSFFKLNKPAAFSSEITKTLRGIGAVNPLKSTLKIRRMLSNFEGVVQSKMEFSMG